ncbi:hypothetical protein TrVE_jg5933 [Triparma verrucosa]|nr:hypothetical protein TrVE_jg5933 [Triparma verrucosa]GMH89997.1 hypothetical protein TrST_g10990 [Triparma strigata]
MVKPIVGQCRAPTYNIPASDFTYGMKSVKNGESAGQVVSSWNVSKQSKAQTTMQSFPATNREALSKGLLTAKEQRVYAKENPVMKTKPTGSSSPKKKLQLKPDQIYGICSEMSAPGHMSLVMSAPDDGPERDYPVYSQATKGKLPLPRPTKSSVLAAQKNTEPEAVAPEFKMKKFQNVKAKVVMG